ncbi:L-ectoine synthase-like [Saccoglossus kowalevskii]|uniref:L-ectoine synthase n=1 Tax=Saccoglossus kowalevskii TaxID=10224 RepID=A0ABM0M9M4_SACKO|nr:PREDICTED: uncharacterized protein LOC100373416 [Saccoglossus kowalevskii]
MIVRHSEDVTITTLPNSDLKGKLLVARDDIMGHIAYDVSVETGDVLKLRSSDSGGLDHMYYCISGSGIVKASNGKTYILQPDTFIAFSSGIEAELSVESRLRLYVIYSEDINPSSERAVANSLKEIIGTEKDVDWKRGHSRRFLVKADGFAVSFNNTLCSAGNSTKLGYMNHEESAYYIKGSTTYSWDEGASIVKTRIGPDSGTIYNMDKHDKHVLTAHEDSIVLCVFYPALRGDENHNHDGEYSGFDA